MSKKEEKSKKLHSYLKHSSHATKNNKKEAINTYVFYDTKQRYEKDIMHGKGVCLQESLVKHEFRFLIVTSQKISSQNSYSVMQNCFGLPCI